MAVRGEGSSWSLGDAAAAAPAPAAAAAAAANAAAAAAAPAAAAASAAPAAAAAAGLHPRGPVESSAIFCRSVRLHGRGERGPGTERAALGVRAWMCVCARESAPARAPSASREQSRGRAGGRRGEGGEEGAGAGRGREGGGKVGGLGQPPAPERAWLPPSLCTPMLRGSGGCSRPPVHPRPAPAGRGAPRGRHLCATPPGPAPTPGVLLSSVLWVG